MTEETLSFEKAFERLEAIVQAMNSGKLSLEDSLKQYEEAAKLIHHAEKLLSNAEKKIEVLMKTGSGAIAMDETGKPLTKDL